MAEWHCRPYWLHGAIHDVGSLSLPECRWFGADFFSQPVQFPALCVEQL